MHAETRLAREPGATATTRRSRVLLVEDSARLAASIRDYLERHGYEVFIEGDGLVVPERFERLKPDLVILDLMLPGKDGLSICRELRRHDGVPILILTAKGENIDQVLGLEMGADDYVVKPVEPRVELTTGDFDILWLLASRQGNVVTRDEILRVVRGIDYDGLDRSIDARICRLRRKLQDAGGAEAMIKTVRLRGYLFTGDA